MRSWQYRPGRAVWPKLLSYFIALALLALTPADLPAACQPATGACTQYSCCLAKAAPGVNTAGTSITCCHAVAPRQQVEFVTPDSGQTSVSSLIHVAPPRIFRSFYEQQLKIRNLSQIHQLILPQIDPLQKTTELLI